MMNQYIISFFRTLSDHTVDKTLFVCGLFLSACELYKQIFIYVAVNHGYYDWWYFPFQLCSLPMYLCLLLPFLPAGRGKTAFYTFMQDYHLLGGIAALIVPEGFSHIHWTLTLHGYLWHILLLLISLFIWISGRSDLSARGFVRTLPIFSVCSAIATIINLLTPGHGQANMFYISPYYPNVQFIFHWIALRLGIHPANLLYLLAISLGAGIIHFLLGAAEKTGNAF